MARSRFVICGMSREQVATNEKTLEERKIGPQSSQQQNDSSGHEELEGHSEQNGEMPRVTPGFRISRADFRDATRMTFSQKWP